MSDLTSRPYKPNPEMCCERCVFGRGEHAAWCWPCLRCGKRLQLKMSVPTVCACGNWYQIELPRPEEPEVCHACLCRPCICAALESHIAEHAGAVRKAAFDLETAWADVHACVKCGGVCNGGRLVCGQCREESLLRQVLAP